MLRYAMSQFCDLSGDPMPPAPASWQAVAVFGLWLRPVLWVCTVGPPMIVAARLVGGVIG